MGQLMSESGVPRQDIYLTTKVWTSEFGLGKVIPSLEVSLEKLGTDYLDLALIHWPSPKDEVPMAVYLEQLAEQRRQEAEEKARQQQLKQEQLEEARRQYEAKQRMQREHQAAITAQMRLAEQERAAQRARDYAARAAQDSDKTSNGGQYPRSTPTACRNCQLQHQRLDADGYCYREVCIRSRAKRASKAEKAEASTRYSYASMRGGANVNRTPQKQTNPVASPQPVSDTQRQVAGFATGRESLSQP